MKIILLALMFSIMKTKKKISDLCVKKYFQKTCRFIFITRKRQKHYLVIEDFNTFMTIHA